MNAVELLKADHEKVQGLFDQVKATESEKQHKQLYKKIKAELEAHAFAEEKVLYPTLKKHEDFKDEVLEAIEEHLQMKTLFRDIDRLSDGSERFDAKLMVLIDDVEHHVEEEEGEMFPKVEKQFSEEDLEEMGMQLEAAKKEFTKQSRAKAASAK
ncbi:MAG: hemerythrin domain-containing protein [Blastocatellia bacterium]